MSLTEQKRLTKRRRNDLEVRFAKQFETLSISGNLCFRKLDGTIFCVCSFLDEAAIVIEYADSYEDAALNRFEDGDRFHLDEMNEETMFQAMLREIEP